MLPLLGIIAAFLAMGFVSHLHAQAPPPPAPPAAQAPPQGVPEWVVKYANNQEQAARACQIQLSQEQSKTDELTKQLADAKQAAAKSEPKK